MPIVRKHSIYAIELSSAVIGDVVGQMVEHETEVRGEPTDGQLYPNFLSIVEQKSTAKFTLLGIRNAFANIPYLGADLSATNLGLYCYKHADGGTRAGSTAHRKFLIQKGILVPRTLTCELGEDARIECEALATYNGSAHSIVESDGVTVPAINTTTERFTLGKLVIGGVTLTQWKKLTIDFKHEIELERGDDDLYPTFASIRSVLTEFTFEGIDVEWLKAAGVPRTGLPATHANTGVYLRKRANASAASFVPIATTEHIKFAAAGLAWCPTPVDGSDEKPVGTTLKLRTMFDGTNAPVVVTTNAAIPA